MGRPRARRGGGEVVRVAVVDLRRLGTLGDDVAAEVERELGVPIDRYRIGGPGLRDLGFTEAYGLCEDGAVLVRPDGHVAWRSATGPAIGAVLRDAVANVVA